MQVAITESLYSVSNVHMLQSGWLCEHNLTTAPKHHVRQSKWSELQHTQDECSKLC